MTLKRKIQQFAAATAIGMAGVLELMSPSPALAAVCTDTVTCRPDWWCQAHATTCAKSGCTLISSFCAWPNSGGCGPGNYLMACNYA